MISISYIVFELLPSRRCDFLICVSVRGVKTKPFQPHLGIKRRELSRTGCCMHRKADEDRATWPRVLLYPPAAIKQWSAVFIDQQHRRVGLDKSREANKCKGWLSCSPKNCKHILHIEDILNQDVWMVCWFTQWTILNKRSRKPGRLQNVSAFLMHSR